MEKECTKCKILKPLDQYYNYKNSKDGKSWYCKDCHRVPNMTREAIYRRTHAKEISEKNKIRRMDPKVKEYYRNYSKLNRHKWKENAYKRYSIWLKTDKGVYCNYKGNARTRKLEFNITLEEFTKVRQGECVFCGKPGPNGIDRIDSSLGYSSSNIQPCCKIHNRMKLAMSMEEFINSCRSVVNYIDKNSKENK